jgi:hypothetical protein
MQMMTKMSWLQRNALVVDAAAGAAVLTEVIFRPCFYFLGVGAVNRTRPSPKLHPGRAFMNMWNLTQLMVFHAQASDLRARIVAPQHSANQHAPYGLAPRLHEQRGELARVARAPCENRSHRNVIASQYQAWRAGPLQNESFC